MISGASRITIRIMATVIRLNREGMKLDIERILPLLLFLLVCTSFVATLPQVTATWGAVPSSAREEPGLRLLREAMLIVIIAACALLDARFWRILLSRNVLTTIIILSAYVAFEVAYALYLGFPLIVPLTGLRVFEYAPLVLVGVLVAGVSEPDRVFRRFAGLLRYVIVIEAILAVRQAWWAPPYYGTSMIGEGGRAFGTFVSPNHFGVTMASCALVFAVAERANFRKWIYVSFALVLLSGSRTAILSAFMVILFQIYYALRRHDRWLVSLPAPFILVGGLVLASDPLISGRNTELADEGRLQIWQSIYVDNVEDAMDFLFGWGLGLGSNTITTLFGSNAYQGQFVPDSLYLFILNGYGTIGLILYFGLLLVTYRTSSHKQKLLVVSFIVMVGVPFNCWEQFPQNAILMFLWGVIIGTSNSRQKMHLFQ
jgi:hypothetical protein